MKYTDYSVSLQASVFFQIALDAISYIKNDLLSYIVSTIYFKISWNFLKGAKKLPLSLLRLLNWYLMQNNLGYVI